MKDYALTCSDTGKSGSLSKAFGDKSELIVIHNMGAFCPGCTAWADGFNGIYHHVQDRAGFLVTSPDDAKDQLKLKRSRGWTFPLVSTKGTTFTKDMGFKDESKKDDPYKPGISTFKKVDGKIFRTSRATICPNDEFSPIFSLLNTLEKGSEGWFPKFNYDTKKSEDDVSVDGLLGIYYEGWNKGDFGKMGGVLADDLHFRGPMQAYDSRKAFIASCEEMKKYGAMDKFKLGPVDKFVRGSEAVLLYELNTDDGKAIPMAEYFKVDDEKISEIRVYFDSKLFPSPNHPQ